MPKRKREPILKEKNALKRTHGAKRDCADKKDSTPYRLKCIWGKEGHTALPSKPKEQIKN